MTEKMTEGLKIPKKILDRKYHCFEPNIWSNFNLVNFDVLIEKVKKITSSTYCFRQFIYLSDIG